MITAERLDTQSAQAYAMHFDRTSLAHTLPSGMNADQLPEQAPQAAQATDPGEIHPGAGGLKSRIRGFLFGANEPKRVGRFVIRRPLGTGGMGSVYLAHDAELERLVALKLVRYDRVSTRTQERLRREAQALAKLAHPNVVPVFEVGEHDGLLFVAMEYVEGSNLREWLAAEPRSESAIVQMFEQAAQGLAAAHQAGLVHRDFKPDNVLVGHDGRVRVVDFGLVASEHDRRSVAEAVAATEDPNTLLTDAPLTQTGELMGTPAYMAPEQFLGETPTPATDQFAFFVALHEALTHQRPFPGATVPELMHAVLAGDSRISQLRSLPPSLRAAVARGVAREPKSRFPDMSAVLDALGQVHAPRRSRALIGLGVAAVGLVCVAALSLSLYQPADAPPLAAMAEQHEQQDEAAAAATAIAPLLASHDEQRGIALAEAYLSQHRDTGGVARQIIAEAAIGGALWRRSCPNAMRGLCIEVQELEPNQPRCGDRRLYSVSRRERVSDDASAALEHLTLATRLASAASMPETTEEQRALADAIGMATTLVADAGLEGYLEIDAPRGLDFDREPSVSELSQDAFGQYFRHKMQEATRAAQAYRAVKSSKSEHWTLVAAARTGLVYDNFADTLAMIPIPSAATDPAESERYCAALAEQSRPLRDQAEAAFDYCRTHAATAGIEDTMCDRLSPIRP